jgi:hypothetical protein
MTPGTPPLPTPAAHGPLGRHARRSSAPLTSRGFAQAVRGLIPLALLAPLAVASAGCGPTLPARSPAADGWYVRAEADFRGVDMDDAHESITKAVQLAPDDVQVRLLAARIALARLEFAEALQLLREVDTSEMAPADVRREVVGIRGRAHWYQGDLEAAADALDSLLNDPDVRDDWAKAISKLARRGVGRKPFQVVEGLLGAEEMPRVHPIAPYFVVPIEIDGEAGLGLIATGTTEVVLDSAQRQEPSWVSVRVGKRFQMSDVPALVQDLSGLSKQVGAPLKALIGVNFLRRANATADFMGRQFVVRSFSPPRPPAATRVATFYLRGGGVVMRSQLGSEDAAFLLDTSLTFPVALDAPGWKKAGVDVEKMALIPEDPSQKLKEGAVPLLRMGSFDIPRVPGVLGVPVDDMEKQLGIDLDGVLGCGMMANFRMTFADQGRNVYLEDAMASLAEVMTPSPLPMPMPAPVNASEPPPAAPKPGKP